MHVLKYFVCCCRAHFRSVFRPSNPPPPRLCRAPPLYCTAHARRDWERIDNLRIDKYYTLVRVFVREALAFCRLAAEAPSSPAAAHPKKKKKRRKGGGDNDDGGGGGGDEEGGKKAAAAQWDLGLLGEISEVMEDEVLTLHPAPIGLRLHFADVWAAEACNAGGEDMPTEAFLVALAPWLRVAAHPATNAVVFKRAFEGIFEGLLEYFPEQEREEEDEMEQDGDRAGPEEKKVFKTVELDQVQACLFEVAAAPQVCLCGATCVVVERLGLACLSAVGCCFCTLVEFRWRQVRIPSVDCATRLDLSEGRCSTV